MVDLNVTTREEKKEEYEKINAFFAEMAYKYEDENPKWELCKKGRKNMKVNLKAMYVESVKSFRKKVGEDKELNLQEWDKFAKENNLFGGAVLMARKDAETWQELKAKYVHTTAAEPIELDLSYIRYIRKAKGYSLEEISKGTGINVRRLSKAEKTNDIRFLDLLKIAAFLGVEEKELYKYKTIE